MLTGIKRFRRRIVSTVQIPATLAQEPKVGAATKPTSDDTTRSVILVYVERCILGRGSIADIDASVNLFEIVKVHPESTVVGVLHLELLLDVWILLPLARLVCNEREVMK